MYFFLFWQFVKAISDPLVLHCQQGGEPLALSTIANHCKRSPVLIELCEITTSLTLSYEVVRCFHIKLSTPTQPDPLTDVRRYVCTHTHTHKHTHTDTDTDSLRAISQGPGVIEASSPII